MTTPNVDAEQSLNEAESEFLRAFRVNDIDGLDSILHADVEFVGPDGAIVDKNADMASHRAGDLEIESVDELSRRVQVIGGIGITRVKLHIKASVGGSPLDAVLMYSRTWLDQDDRWSIVAAHGSILSGGTW